MTALEWTIAFFILWFLFLRNIRIRVVKEEQQQNLGGEKIEQEYFNSLKPPIICHTEFIESQIYVWDKETNTFLIQGKTMDEVVEFFKENYPGRKIILVEKKEA